MNSMMNMILVAITSHAMLKLSHNCECEIENEMYKNMHCGDEKTIRGVSRRCLGSVGMPVGVRYVIPEEGGGSWWYVGT